MTKPAISRMGRIASFGLFLLTSILLLAACVTEQPEFINQEPTSVTVRVDGQEETYITESGNVRELLDEVDINFQESDLVDPPLFTPLTDGMEINITRVTESIEIMEQTIPFQRRTVRNESMRADSDPIIVQSGRSGLQELTVRIVYHDGLEFSRQQTQVTVIEPAQDEVVMIGVGLAQGAVEFPGLLAFINGGNSILLRGSSSVPEQLNTGSDLDQRVFSLSPTGAELLYTRVLSDTDTFNSLWVISTEPGAEPRSLGIDNVLWADWNPAAIDEKEIAFTTGIPTKLLPGWEANNDLWIGQVPSNRLAPFRPEQLIESYPATYGWWGGNYEWSPNGRFIAYSFADEMGLIDTEAANENQQRVNLLTFTEFNTGADWVWVPSLSWAPDGQFVAFTRHDGEDIDSGQFDLWIVNSETGLAREFVPGAGIWGHPEWSPQYIAFQSPSETDSQVAFLKATNPLESQRSTYTLWMMDRDGSNPRQVYPPAGENSRFAREDTSLTWGPLGQHIAFVYNDDLYIYNLLAGETRQLTQDDNKIANPTWAPYGPAAESLIEVQRQPTFDEPPFPFRGSEFSN